MSTVQLSKRPRAVYSPRINAELIPVLYHTAKAKTMPMTSLVDILLYRALAVEPLPREARGYLTDMKLRQRSQAGLTATTSVESDLEERIRATPADAFAKTAEVEAWYQGCEHGLLRSGQLLARHEGSTDARAEERLNVLRLLNVFRHDSLRVLTECGA